MSTTNKVTNTLIHILLGVLSVIWILPIVWLLITSFRGQPTGAFPQVDINAYKASGDILGGIKAVLIPTEWTLDNYILLFTDQTLFKFPRWFMNTLIVAVCSSVLSTIIVLLTSYALSRLRFKLRKPIMNVMLILGMFPGFMSMIAIYHILKALGLSQSLLSLVLVYSGGAAMGYYVSKGFFDTLPKEIDEAAMLDGASRNDIFWKITLPLSKPIVVYTILTSFISPWVDFIFVSIIMKDNYDMYTVALGLYQMLTRENIDAYFTRFAAGAVLVAIPITLLFIKMQKYYVSGVTGGAVKG
ncbi:MAG: sugar ABC transporter permease [Erysipelotrichales bacterium]|nr:sugar ABC transporter permease [Erysipelotrichales bacterium]